MLRQADAPSIGILRDVGIYEQSNGYGAGFEKERESECTGARFLDLVNELGLVMSPPGWKQVVDTPCNNGGTPVIGLQIFPIANTGLIHLKQLVHSGALLRKDGSAGSAFAPTISTSLDRPKKFLNTLLREGNAMNVEKFSSYGGETRREASSIIKYGLKNEGNFIVGYIQRSCGTGVFNVNPGSVIVFHFLQLVAQNASLQPENGYSQNTDKNQRAGPTTNYLRPFCYFTIGVVCIVFGWIITGYAVPYGSSKNYQTRQYINDSVISFGLLVIACLIVGQGIYLIFLATTDSRAEDVGIETIIVPELKLRDVQRHIFGADLVEAAESRGR